MDSYSTRNYAGTYQGEPLTSIVSYKGVRTATPLMIYHNAYEGTYNGFSGIYTNARTSAVGWQSTNLENYTKEYSGFINYVSDDIETYTKTYGGAGTFAGVKAFQAAYIPGPPPGYSKKYVGATGTFIKTYVPAGGGYTNNTYLVGNYLDSGVWAAANIAANYTGVYAATQNYTRVVGFLGEAIYNGQPRTNSFEGAAEYAPSYNGFNPFVNYNKDYSGSVSYTRNWTKSYESIGSFIADYGDTTNYIKTYTGALDYNVSYLASWNGLTTAATAYVIKQRYNKLYQSAWTKVWDRDWAKSYGAGEYSANYSAEYEASYIGNYDKDWLGIPAQTIYNKEYAGLAIYVGAARTSAVTANFMGGVNYLGAQTWGGYSNSTDTTDYLGISGYVGYTGSPRYQSITGFSATFYKSYMGSGAHLTGDTGEVPFSKNFSKTYTTTSTYLGSAGYATYNAAGIGSFIGPRLWGGFVETANAINYKGELYYNKVYTKVWNTYSVDYTKAWRAEQAYEGTWTANYGDANYIGVANWTQGFIGNTVRHSAVNYLKNYDKSWEGTADFSKAYVGGSTYTRQYLQSWLSTYAADYVGDGNFTAEYLSLIHI